MSHPAFTLSTTSQTLTFDPVTHALTVVDNTTGQRLLFTSGAAPFRPVFDGQPVELSLERIETAEHAATLHYSGAGVADFTFTVTALPAEDCLEFSCAFESTAVTQLNRLELLPADTVLNMYDLVNFRSRHHTARMWPELSLGGAGFITDTYSGDWHFSPHAAMFIFRKAEASLFFSAYDLPVSTFGMYFAVENYRVKTWHLDYGTEPWGMPLAARERFRSPRFRLLVRPDQSVYELIDGFSAMLIRERQIPDPALKHRESWWREPLYCTWVDQWHLSHVELPEALQDQAAMKLANSPQEAIDDELVREVVAVMQRERLPFRIMLLDDGWAVARGQWEPHPDRFPDLRKLVDDLHADGLKVVVWWNWAEIQDHAEVNPAHLIAGGKLNKHGARMRDYSLPATREEYLKPLFHQLFSPDPGCYDLDGVKTDFLPDKVHADMPVHDPAWRGEENYYLRMAELFYTEMRRHKPDAIHLGGGGHFYLAQWHDLNRTYDVHNSNYLEHEERARMLLHLSPGTPASYDFHELENLDRWFASARELGAAVEIGNILTVRDDWFTDPRPADAAYYELLRKWLL